MLIFYVDDDSDDREFFSDAIKALDPEIHCVVFADGEALLNYLEKNKTAPDYIFIDMNMPKMNGDECAREITSRYSTSETQIVMYSTAVNPIDSVRFDELGFKYVIKQNSLGALVQSIKHVMAYMT